MISKQKADDNHLPLSLLWQHKIQLVLCLIFAVLSMQGSLKTIQQYLYVLMHYNVPEDEIKRLTQAYQLDNNADPDPEEDEDNAED